MSPIYVIFLCYRLLQPRGADEWRIERVSYVGPSAFEGGSVATCPALKALA